jgi:hypothetical protein
MRSLGVFLLMFGIIAAILLAVGAGIGFLLHWLLPALDLGVGMLIGVVTLGITAQLFARTLSVPFFDLDDDLDTPPPLPPRITYIDEPEPPRRSRGRKRKPASS